MQMPDTTTRRRSLWNSPGVRLFYAMLFCTSMLLLSSPALFAQGTGDATKQACPGAQPVDTFTGTGNQMTPVFQTTGDSFRVSFDATETDTESGFLSIFVDDADGNPVSTVSQETVGPGESFVNEGPGGYVLDISSFGVDYTISVEDCTGGAAPNDPPEQPQDTDTPKGNVQTAQGPEIQQTPQTGGVALLPVAGAFLLIGSVAGGLFSLRRR